MSKQSDLDYMLDCIACHFSYKAYVEMCDREHRVYVDEQTYDEVALDASIKN